MTEKDGCRMVPRCHEVHYGKDCFGHPLTPAQPEFIPSAILDKFIDRQTMRDALGVDTKDIARALYEAHDAASRAQVDKAVETDQSALKTALELIEDLRGYCRESWDWKYKDWWDEETAKVASAIRGKP